MVTSNSTCLLGAHTTPDGTIDGVSATFVECRGPATKAATSSIHMDTDQLRAALESLRDALALGHAAPRALARS